jgi:small-conductance mechanosensitive channel
MKPGNIQLIETLIILGVYIALYFVFKTLVNNYLKKTTLQRGRRKMTIRSLQLFTTITALIFLTGVWGFKQNEIALFASTILTALGIAFFAQWSLLSNITSSILIFFNHPVKIGSTVKVLHKDFQYEGEVTDLNYFFIHLKTKKNEIITIPNSHFLSVPFSITEQDSENSVNPQSSSTSSS